MGNGFALLETRDLTKIYGKGQSTFTALKEVSISIRKGESVAIVGKSGSGKSTLMHLLALLDTPTSGVVQVDGVDVSKIGLKQLDHLRNNVLDSYFNNFS